MSPVAYVESRCHDLSSQPHSGTNMSGSERRETSDSE